MKMDKIKKGIAFEDVLLTIVVLFLLFLVPYAFASGRFSGGEKEVLIFKDSKEIKRIGLDKEQNINIDGMELEVRGGRIRVVKSDCPREMCKNFGWISAPGQTIVCVPKRIIVEISGKSKEQEYNTLSY